MQTAARNVWTRPAADRGSTSGWASRPRLERTARSGAANPLVSTRDHSSHGELSQGRPGHAIDLSDERLTRAAVVVAWAASAGCQRLPYIDQSKEVPHEPLGTIAQEDKEVKKAQFLGTLADAVAPDRQAANDQRPRGAGDLAAAASGRDPGRPRQLRGRPRDLAGCPGHSGRRLRADAVERRCRCGHRQRARCQPAADVYDPAIQETQIATALSNFDTNFTTSMLWGHSVAPFNNAISAGTFIAGAAVPGHLQPGHGHVPVGPPETDGDGCLARRDAQHQLPLLEQPDQRHAVGLYDQHAVQPDPAVARQRPAGGRSGRPRRSASRPTGRRS